MSLKDNRVTSNADAVQKCNIDLRKMGMIVVGRGQEEEGGGDNEQEKEDKEEGKYNDDVGVGGSLTG
jgi:hypothetical protein